MVRLSLIIFVFCYMSFCLAKTSYAAAEDTNSIIIDSHVYREPGCPLVPERNGFNSSAVEGSWHFAYGSIGYYADMGHALFGKYPTVSELQNLCLYVEVRSLTPDEYSNKTFVLEWTFPKHRRAPMYLNCWPQRPTTQTKFECYFEEERLHTYVMVAATDHKTWLLLIRCKIGIDRPGEGMTWALLSKEKSLDPDVAQVAFGVLAGYGFDMLSNKFGISYDVC